MSIFKAFRIQWGNGGRLLIYVFGAAGLLLLANVYLLASQLMEPEFRPMTGSGYTRPQPAQDEVLAGGTLHVGPVTKCNTSGDDLIIIANLSWRMVSPKLATVADGQRTMVRAPGCTTGEYENRVPPELAPGIWEYHGTEEVIGPDNEIQRIGWRTEPFTIVGGDG